MKKYVLISCVYAGIAVFVSGAPLFTNNPVADFLQQGELDGQVGVAGHYQDFRQETVTNLGVAWGFVEASYITPSVKGFRVGGGFLGIVDLWEDHPGNYESVFVDDFDISQCYLSYDVLETSNTLLIGRALFEMNPGMRGEGHQGAQLVAGFENITLAASVVERWIHHETALFTADGITGWKNVDDLYEEAGGQYYAASLDTRWLEEQLAFSPFVDYQSDVMMVYGAQFSFTQPLREGCHAGVDGIGAMYDNRVPESVASDYEDVTSALLHASVGRDTCWAGLGWFYLSDDKGNLNAGVFQDFDPLKEDDLFPYGDLNNADLFYVDGHFTLGAFSTDVAFGYGKNEAIDSYSRELDLWLYYDITSSVQWAGYFIWTDYDTDLISAYSLGGMSLAYSF